MYNHSVYTGLDNFIPAMVAGILIVSLKNIVGEKKSGVR